MIHNIYNIYNIQYTVYSVQYTMYNIQYIISKVWAVRPNGKLISISVRACLRATW